MMEVLLAFLQRADLSLPSLAEVKEEYRRFNEGREPSSAEDGPKKRRR